MFKEKIGPFMRSKNSTKKMMLNLMIVLIPICLFAIFKNGVIPFYKGKKDILELIHPIIFLIIGPLTTYITEYIYVKLFHKENKEYLDNSYSFIPGLFLALLLPVNTPIIYLISGSIIATILGKMLFGGFGQNIFNPALIGYLFIMTMYSSNFTYLNSYELDTIAGPTPLANLSTLSSISYNEVVAPYGNLLDFFIGNIPGSLGETSALLCLIGFLYLTIKKVIKWRIPLVYISTVFLITFIIGLTNNIGLWYPLFQILSGGLFFGAIFMATDPVTSPTTKEGQVIFGLLLGILTVILRYLSSAPEGVSIAIITMNMLVFIIENISIYLKNNRMKYIITVISIVLLSILLGYSISTKYSNPTIDTSFNIISKEIINDGAKYIVTQVGNGGKIKAEIIIKNDKITEFKVLEHNETSVYYQKLLDKNFIDELLNNKELDKVDTVSGATITSNALKKMAINTLKDYKTGSKENIKNEEETTFKIIEVNKNNEETIYKVSDNSFGGTLVLELTLKENKIIKAQTISYNDTCMSKDNTNEYYDCPSYIDEINYIQRLIDNQDKLNEVDTISGVTISSKSLKKIFEEAIRYDGDNNE